MAYRRTKTNIRRAPRRKRRTSVRRVYAPRRATLRRRTQRRQRVTECKCPGEMSPGEKFVMIQSDPFDTKYFGAKIPDSSTIPSLPTPLQYNYSLTTDPASQPNWAHAWAFYPCVKNANVRLNGLSPTSWSVSSFSTSDAPQASSFLTQFEAYRPVAHSIRLSCPFAPTTTTGFVHIAIATETVFTAGGSAVQQITQLASNLSDLSGYTFYKRVTLASLTQSPITLINKWTDETAFRYQSPAALVPTDATAGPNTFHVPFSWGTLMVAVEGVSSATAAAAITPLQAEVTLHSECIPQKTSTLLGSTAAAYSSGVLNAVSQAVAQTDFAHTEDQQENTIRSYAEEVANAMGTSTAELQGLAGQAVRAGLRYGARYVAGGAARRMANGIGGVNNNPYRLAIDM